MILGLLRMPSAAPWVLLGLLVTATACAGPTIHRDGEGPMASFNDPEGFSRMAVDPTGRRRYLVLRHAALHDEARDECDPP